MTKRRYSVNRHNPLPWVAAVLLLFAMLAGLCLFLRRAKTRPRAKTAEPPVLNQLATVVWPTACVPTGSELRSPAERIFQPTASGRVRSALYGSVRTATGGSGLHARFHEGLDIRAHEHDRRGRAQDTVRAIAQGTIAYINRIAGNSSYGRYVVVTHRTPLGTVYSLYAHLAKLARGLAPGQECAQGAALGTIGNSGTQRIPRSRSHLHFETGLIANSHFPAWHAQTYAGTKSNHGTWHGWNLLGIDPLDFFLSFRESGAFDWRMYLSAQPAAFSLLVKASEAPDYFLRYPSLWTDTQPARGAIVLQVSEGGVLLGARNATEEEKRRLPDKRAATVLHVDEAALGRNGRHLIRRAASGWRLAPHGQRWLGILMYGGRA